MNKQELFEKALAEFDVWPYYYEGMIYCIKGYECEEVYTKGEFSSFTGCSSSHLNTNNWTFVCTRSEFEAAKAEQKAKDESKEEASPVYTKTMQQEGLPPKVNSKVDTCFGEGICVSDRISTDCMIPIFYQNRSKFSLVHISDIYPIDTRTPEQEIVDTLTTYFEEAMATEDTPPSFYAEGLFERIENGEFAGLRLEEDPS